ncbi:60S acidic ribosomal protein P2, partial [Haematococcus lacustris]
MKHVAALLLAQLGGNANPSEADVKKILSSVGVEADDEKLSKLMSEVSGKDISGLIAEGKTKLATWASPFSIEVLSSIITAC